MSTGATGKGKRKLTKDQFKKDEKQPSILSYFASPPKSTKCEIRVQASSPDPEADEVDEELTNSKSKRPKLLAPESKNGLLHENCITPAPGTVTEEDSQTQKNLHALVKELGVLDPNMGLSWFEALKSEFDKDFFKKLNNFVVSARKQGLVYPPPEHVWEWTKQTNIRDIKVVILGQDPYHGPNQAHGLCFSVMKGVRPPPSLNNMYKELQKDIPNFTHPQHGYLIGWAQQGVLLLNAVLTVQSGKPNSHKDKGWEQLTDAVIKWISQNLDSVVFLLWGAYAQKKAAFVDKKKHHLLQSAHPSPFSADRGFFGSKHFSKCNELLVSSGKVPIDWTQLP